MARKNRIPEENECWTNTHELLKMENINSMDDIHFNERR